MINVRIPEGGPPRLEPRIVVIGVGGAGGNAVNNMIDSQLDGVDFVTANTDAQSLESALAPRKIQLGRSLTRGLGAGSRPEIGREAAEEELEDIANCLDGADMAFITAGMGGGTGTGAAPVIARAAREQGILTVGVVTKPFDFEGPHRMRVAEQGLSELQQYVDTMIVIPNQNLFLVADQNTTFAEAFTRADEVLHAGVRGVTDLIVVPGIINLDFADIRTVMSEMGKAMMGTGEASGDKRAVEAAQTAISNPLLDEISLKGARAMLVNITGGMDMSLFEVDEAVNAISEQVDSDANIKVGACLNPDMEGRMRISVIATGMESDEAVLPRPANVHSLAERRAASTPAKPVPAEAEAEAAAPVAQEMPAEAPQTAEPAKAQVDLAFNEPQVENVSASAEPAPNPALEDAFMPPEPVRPARPPVRTDLRAEPRGEMKPDPMAAADYANGASPSAKKADAGFFGRVTRGLRATKPEETAAAADAPKAPSMPPPLPPEARGDVTVEAGPVQQRLDIAATPPAAPKTAASPEDPDLDIPAFLRRQAN